MQVTIRSVPVEIPVITVTLMNDRLDPTKLMLMHCIICGQPLVQYMGKVIQIIPGGLPMNMLETQAHLLVHCGGSVGGTRGCKQRYLINGIV